MPRVVRRFVVVGGVAAVIAAVAIGVWRADAQSGAIDAAALLRDTERLSADDMEGRQTGSAGAARARAYIVERFTASGIRPFGASYLHEFQVSPAPGGDGPRGVTANVVGYVSGREVSARYIVVSAHYDHVGVSGGRIFNGANDNASGTAALLALGRYFSANPARHSIVFAAFDAEEIALNGARAFVSNPPVERSSIVLNINADMVGRDSDNHLYVSGTFGQPLLKPPVARVAARAPVTLLMGHDDPSDRSGDNWMQRADQWAFIEAGIPGLYVGVEDREHYHRATDDYANLTHRFFVNAVETIRLLVLEFDEHLLQ